MHVACSSRFLILLKQQRLYQSPYEKVNLLSPKSDKHLIPPYNVTPESNIRIASQNKRNDD